MSTKTIDLIVLEEGQEQRVPLVRVSLDELPPRTRYQKLFSSEDQLLKLNEDLTLQSLMQNYLKGVVRIHRLFTEIVEETTFQDKVTFENITARPFAYSMPDAYQKIKPIVLKEKEDDADLIPGAHLCWKQGIFIGLNQHSSLEYLLATNIHEHAHHMHYLLHREQYEKSDATMIELMAIFSELKCNIPVDYRPVNYNPVTMTGETPHYRAEKILRRLHKKEQYAKMDSAQQWRLLTTFRKHEKLQEYLACSLK